MATGAALLGASHIAELSAFAGDRFRLPWYLLAAGFAVAETRSLYLHFRGETHSFTLAEIVFVLGLFFAAPIELVIAELLGAGVVYCFQRLPLLKILFNLAQLALSGLVAVVVFRALVPFDEPLGIRAWVAALVAGLVCSVIGETAIMTAVSLMEGRVGARAVLETYGLAAASATVNAMLGLVGVVVLWHEPVAVLLLAGPIVVLFVAYRAYLSERSKSQGLEFLYNASQVLNEAPDLEDGLVALLDFARGTLHAEVAEIVVCGDDETTAFRTVVGPGDVRSRMAAVSRASVDAVLTPVAGTTRAVLLRGQDAAELPTHHGMEVGYALVAPLAGESGLRGAVLLANAPGGVRTFGKEDVKLFETFASHLGVTLEKSQLSTSLAQLRALKNELAHQAYHDSLTGLANRVLFRERVQAGLERVAATGSGLAVLFIDLDDFKTVNDTMGHAAGDTLLQVVGERISACVGEEDTAARLGGDEFAVLLTDCSNEADMRVVAERILVSLGDPIEIDGQPVAAHASIGVATHASAADADELMQNADVAMYTAKRNGKGRCDVFEPNLSLSVARRHQVKVGLERAITRNEFVLHYQPVVNVASGDIVATEALLRWKEPARGLLPPSEFMSIAEETGLIAPIGRFVLREACRQAKEWEALAPNIRMFVNLSARQLADVDLLADVASALADSGLHPSRLVLEVTETAMKQDIEDAQAMLVRLKQLGVGLGIDDFGTGYSSLSYLRQLPIDVLKIAKPFVDAIDDTPEDAAFVQGIVKLGHVVGMHVIAEGVERVEQSAHLVDMGCDSAQGYYYARSLEPESVVALLRRSSPSAQLRDNGVVASVAPAAPVALAAVPALESNVG